MNNNTYAVIMAGGIGSRFWPLSRSSKPKQFLDILNMGKTLIQMTYERYTPICPKENIFIVTNEEYVSIVKEQLPFITDQQILKEPSRKNTAPCVMYACHKIYSINPDAHIIVAPSDHLILKEADYLDVLKTGIEFCKKNNALITLGIKPTRPDTGYGYIQYLDHEQDIKKVKTFTEKPSKDIAATFLKSGDFLWNSGMFVWSAKSILEAFEEFLPEMIEAFKGGEKHYNTDTEFEFISEAYSQSVNISIDYGIMEKASNVFVIPSDFGWSDVGTWGSIYDIYEKDYLQNAVDGKLVKTYDASNNMISVQDNKLVVIQGLDGYCVIDTADVLLIIKKEEEQEIKQITSDMKRIKLDKFL
ncbi:MAG: mannose-1-phosphate guanylyltransferase [Bacteroidota bacterium]